MADGLSITGRAKESWVHGGGVILSCCDQLCRCAGAGRPWRAKSPRPGGLQVRDVAASFVNIWERVGDLLADLDVLASFAHAATVAPTPYCRPEMLGGEAGELVLKQARHPCLELQDGMDVIPNDCVMSRGDSWFHIITGPNMGGKSTFIRQVR